jgi:hypothetical protein
MATLVKQAPKRVLQTWSLGRTGCRRQGCQLTFLAKHFIIAFTHLYSHPSQNSCLPSHVKGKYLVGVLQAVLAIVIFSAVASLSVSLCPSGNSIQNKLTAGPIKVELRLRLSPPRSLALLDL